jgi:2-iminobutanoate/2-iminopropanoate deaminase
MKKILNTKDAPQAIGPYNQSVVANGFVYLSGQLPINPATGEMVRANIEEQTIQVLENIKAVLSAHGLGLKHVVKTTCFLSDLSNFTAFNEVYARYFSDDAPARSTIEVSRLPKDSLIEIEVIAILA